MPKVKTVPVNKDVLVWARESAGLKLDDAALRLKVSSETLGAWEHGQGLPPLTIFKRMVTLYQRSPTILLIPQPPPPEELPQDFRTLGGAVPEVTSETILAIREARYIQEELSDLAGAQPGILPYVDLGHASLSDLSDAKAVALRTLANVSVQLQLNWAREDSFKHWRSRVQEWGILVLSKKMPLEECRGVSLAGDTLVPTIVVNNADGPEANSFTLFHEVAHVLLRQDGMCLYANAGVEKWCNEFAAAFLVPEEALRVVKPDLQIGRIRTWTLAEVQAVARRLKVSRHVVALRLQALRTAPPDLYDQVLSSPTLKPSEKKEGGAPKPPIRTVAELGTGVTNAVFKALSAEVIDVTGASQILSLKPKWFGEAREWTDMQRQRFLQS